MIVSEIILNIGSIIAGVFLHLLGWGIIGGSFSSEEFRAKAKKRRWLWRICGFVLICFGIAGLIFKETKIG